MHIVFLAKEVGKITSFFRCIIQSGKSIAKTKEGFKEGRPKKHTPKQMENALSMLSINGGKYSYKEVEEITNISKSTLIREMRKRKEV